MNRGWKIAVIIALIVLIIAIVIYWRRIFRKVSQIILKPQQEAFISKLHPQVQEKFRQFIARVEKETGYRIILTSGYRTFAQQQKQYIADTENVPKPGYSMHNYGLAIDINATNGVNYLSKSDSNAEWEKSGIPRIAREMGFTTGVDFKSYHDPVHIGFDRTYDIDELRASALNQFGTDWNTIQGNQIQIT